jgi:hypothetical protein
MAQLQVFQTGWNECIKALRMLTVAPRVNESVQESEAYDYLIPANAIKAPSNT